MSRQQLVGNTTQVFGSGGSRQQHQQHFAQRDQRREPSAHTTSGYLVDNRNGRGAREQQQQQQQHGRGERPKVPPLVLRRGGGGSNSNQQGSRAGGSSSSSSSSSHLPPAQGASGSHALPPARTSMNQLIQQPRNNRQQHAHGRGEPRQSRHGAASSSGAAAQQRQQLRQQLDQQQQEYKQQHQHQQQQQQQKQARQKVQPFQQQQQQQQQQQREQQRERRGDHRGDHRSGGGGGGGRGLRMPEPSLAGGGGAQRSPERLLCDTARLDTSRLSSSNAVGVDTITSTGKGTSSNQDSSLVARFANGGLGGGYSGPGVNKSEACDSPIAARGGVGGGGGGGGGGSSAAALSGSPVGRGTMLVGVFDGHGDAGHRVSRAAAAALQKRVEHRLKEEIRKAEKKQPPPRGGGGDKENSDKHRDDKGGRDGGRVRKDDGRGQTGSGSGDIAARVMYQSLRDVRTEIEKTNIDTTFSGTTAVAALRHGEHLIVGNIGDSRAVLGRRTQVSGGKPAGIKAVELSCDHTPEYDAERLKKLNSRVHPSMVPAGPGGQYRFMGPQRVWDKTGVHGLAMARSLGDTHLAPFVTPEPEVTCKRLDRDDKFLIIGSDGIWDCINSQEAVTIAARFSKPKDAAAALCKIARERWKAGTGGQMSDDITAVVTRL